MPRYVFLAAIATIRLGPAEERREMWIGLESPRPLDVGRFSREHGYHLIPADTLAGDELASIDVHAFQPVDVDVDGAIVFAE